MICKRKHTHTHSGKRRSKVRGEVLYSVEVERPRTDLFISREQGCHTREDAESGAEGRRRCIARSGRESF